MSSGSQEKLKLSYIYVSVLICILSYNILFTSENNQNSQVQNLLLYSLYRMVTVLVTPCVVCDKDFMFYINILWMCSSSVYCGLKNKELIDEMFRMFGNNVWKPSSEALLYKLKGRRCQGCLVNGLKQQNKSLIHDDFDDDDSDDSDSGDEDGDDKNDNVHDDDDDDDDDDNCSSNFSVVVAVVVVLVVELQHFV